MDFTTPRAMLSGTRAAWAGAWATAAPGFAADGADVWANAAGALSAIPASTDNETTLNDAHRTPPSVRVYRCAVRVRSACQSAAKKPTVRRVGSDRVMA